MENLITFKDKRFKVLRVIPVDQKPKVDKWKEHLQVDTVLKKDGLYFFCHEIKETEIVANWNPDKKEWIEVEPLKLENKNKGE